MTTDPPPRRTRAILLRVLRLILIPYLAVVATMYFLQEWLIFPGHDSHGTRQAQVVAPEGAVLLKLKTMGGEDVAALFGPALDGEGKPVADARSRLTIVFCYGNAMWLNQCHDRFEDFRRLGANVIIPEYLGYGMSGGKVGESGCYDAADAVWRWLQTSPDVDPKKIVATGWSLGSGVAVDLAAKHPEILGLATFSAFTCLAEVAGRDYPWLPVSLLLKHRFASEDKLPGIACPVFLAHGDQDEVIPFAMMERLAKVAKGKVTPYVVQGADHNGIFATGGRPLHEAFRAFLDTLGG